MGAHHPAEPTLDARGLLGEEALRALAAQRDGRDHREPEVDQAEDRAHRDTDDGEDGEEDDAQRELGALVARGPVDGEEDGIRAHGASMDAQVRRPAGAALRSGEKHRECQRDDGAGRARFHGRARHAPASAAPRGCSPCVIRAAGAARAARHRACAAMTGARGHRADRLPAASLV